ncbi:hypothetical protein IQ07DRAFT_408536 [Pyrenochaeta sp. DS3sAY3a]|nr:hypothetical protein IQ07DRAFT_408536 [Pyrenochaeta sp. DS3sAY3a]
MPPRAARGGTPHGGQNKPGNANANGRGSARDASGSSRANSANPPPLAQDDYAGRLKYLRNERPKIRQQLIAQRLMNPEGQMRIEDSIPIIGLCIDLCPEFERVRRIEENDVPAPECTPETEHLGRANRIPDETRMVKAYARSAAGMDTELVTEIRSPTTCLHAIDHMMERLDTNDFDFLQSWIWDRARAVRKDLRTQSIRKQSSIQIFLTCLERTARFHILSMHQMAGSKKTDYSHQQDMEQLNQTLMTLKEQYLDNRRADIANHNEAEIFAYRVILTPVYADNHLEYSVHELPDHLKNNGRVQTAIEIQQLLQLIIKGKTRSFVQCQENWQKLWELIKSPRVSYLMACAAEVTFNRVRHAVLDILWRACRQGNSTKSVVVEDWTTDRLKDVLGFDTDREAVRHCEDFGFVFARNSAGQTFLDISSMGHSKNMLPVPDADREVKPQYFSESLVESKRYGRPFSAVIKGMSVVEARRSFASAQTEMLITRVGSEDEGDSLFVPEHSSTNQPFKAASKAEQIPSDHPFNKVQNGSPTLNPAANPFLGPRPAASNFFNKAASTTPTPSNSTNPFQVGSGATTPNPFIKAANEAQSLSLLLNSTANSLRGLKPPTSNFFTNAASTTPPGQSVSPPLNPTANPFLGPKPPTSNFFNNTASTTPPGQSVSPPLNPSANPFQLGTGPATTPNPFQKAAQTAQSTNGFSGFPKPNVQPGLFDAKTDTIKFSPSNGKSNTSVLENANSNPFLCQASSNAASQSNPFQQSSNEPSVVSPNPFAKFAQGQPDQAATTTPSASVFGPSSGSPTATPLFQFQGASTNNSLNETKSQSIFSPVPSTGDTMSSEEAEKNKLEKEKEAKEQKERDLKARARQKVQEAKEARQAELQRQKEEAEAELQRQKQLQLEQERREKELREQQIRDAEEARLARIRERELALQLLSDAILLESEDGLMIQYIENMAHSVAQEAYLEDMERKRKESRRVMLARGAAAHWINIVEKRKRARQARERRKWLREKRTNMKERATTSPQMESHATKDRPNGTDNPTNGVTVFVKPSVPPNARQTRRLEERRIAKAAKAKVSSQPKAQVNGFAKVSVNHKASTSSIMTNGSATYSGYSVAYQKSTAPTDRTETDWFELRAKGIDPSKHRKRSFGSTTSDDEEVVATETKRAKLLSSSANNDDLPSKALVPAKPLATANDQLARFRAIQEAFKTSGSTPPKISTLNHSESQPNLVNGTKSANAMVIATSEPTDIIARAQKVVAKSQISPSSLSKVQHDFGRSVPNLGLSGSVNSRTSANKKIGSSSANARPAYWNRSSRFVPRHLYGKGPEAIRAFNDENSSRSRSASKQPMSNESQGQSSSLPTQLSYVHPQQDYSQQGYIGFDAAENDTMLESEGNWKPMYTGNNFHHQQHIAQYQSHNDGYEHVEGEQYAHNTVYLRQDASQFHSYPNSAEEQEGFVVDQQQYMSNNFYHQQHAAQYHEHAIEDEQEEEGDSVMTDEEDEEESVLSEGDADDEEVDGDDDEEQAEDGPHAYLEDYDLDDEDEEDSELEGASTHSQRFNSNYSQHQRFAQHPVQPFGRTPVSESSQSSFQQRPGGTQDDAIELSD